MKRELATHLQQIYAVSMCRSCRVIRLDRKVYRYRSKRYDQGPLRVRIREIAESRVRYGCRRIHVLLRREGWVVNHKRVHRLYKLEGLNLRRKIRRHKSSTARTIRDMPTQANQAWTMDFVHDQLFNGKRIRFLTVVDVYTRECLVISVGQRLTGEDVVEAMHKISEHRTYPNQIFVDNGSEFCSKRLDHWAYQHQVMLVFSRPGKPTDNAFIESFNGSFRDECLNVHWFLSLEDAKMKVENWRQDYNLYRPHSGLNNLTPTEFSAKLGDGQT